MTRTLTTLALLLLASACGTTEGEGAARVCSSTAAIVDGTVSTEERSTVSVGGVCTGVLVGPYTVLTAAHCHESADYVARLGAVASVWDRIPHPTADIEVLVLADPLPGPYAPIGSPRLGPALVQGYGLDEDGNSGTLREVEVVFDHITATHAYTPPGPGPCYGDSGGPLYQDGAVVALVERGRSTGECGEGSKNVTPDAFLGWLELVAPDALTVRDSGC